MSRSDEIQSLLATLAATQQRIRELVGDDLAPVLLSAGSTEDFSHAERALQLFEVVTKVARVGGWRLDVASQQLEWSDEVFAIHDLPPGESLTAAQAMAYCAPEWRAHVQERAAACTQRGESVDEEFEIITAKGRRTWVRTTGEAVRDAEGRITHMQGALQDISREKGAEVALAMSENRFQRIASALPMLIWTADADGRVDYANDRFSEISGHRGEDIDPGEWLETIAPEDRPRARREWERAVREGSPYSVEYQILTADGERRWVRMSAAPVRGEDGRILKWYGSGIDIHDRVLAEDQALRLANQLQVTLNSISDRFVALDHEWRYTFLNQRALEFLQRSLSDVLGQVIWEVFPTLRGTALEEGLWQVMHSREPRRFEYASKFRNEILEVSAYPSDDGGIAIYFRDVSDQVRAREDLEHQEARFRAVTQAATDVVWDWDITAGRIWWSQGLSEVFGHPEGDQETSTQVWIDRLHPDDRDRVPAGMREAVRTRQHVWRDHYRFRHADGRYREVDDRGVLIADGGGEPVRFVGGMSDVTERREAERVLARHAALLDQARDAIVLFDGADRIQFWNRSAERIYGWSAADVMGQTLESVLGGDAEAYGHALTSARSRGDWRGRLSQRRADGSLLTVEGHWVRVEPDASPLGPDGNGAVMAINTDISEQILLEEQLNQAQRLESVGQLTGGIAHDFNNLLTIMLGNSDLLVEELHKDRDLQDLASMIQTAAERAAELTSRLLAFARKQPLDPRNVEVNRLVSGMDRMLRRTLGEHVEIELVQGAGVWEALVDEGQLENALLNLCINARDAMPGGGKLVIETGNAWLDENYAAQHSEVVPGQYVQVTVSDDGTGMTRDTLERAFDPFFTTKEVGRGSGLGLSMVYGFIKQSRGHVRIYSELGEGTMVRLYLPRALRKDEASLGVDGGKTLRGAGERILVVEDDQLVREHTVAQLESLGYRVVSAANGPEGLEVLRQIADFDLLFTDVVMPGGMSGRDLADAARLIRPKLPVLFTSGYTENAIVHQGRLDPGVQLLNKPFRKQDLAAKVRRMLDVTHGK